MNKLQKLMAAMLLFPVLGFADETTLTLEQVLQRVVDNSIALEVAKLKTQRSGLEKDKPDSMLGWQLGGQTSFSHDVGFGSIPQDTLRLNSNASRLLSDGSVIGLSAGYSFTDADAALFPALPNPSHDATLDLNYRRPLWQGAGLPAYANAKKLASLGEQASDLQRFVVQDQLANQTVELFYNLVAVQAQLDNAQKAVERTRRLLQYNKRNRELGLSEKKDILQVNAQIKAREADLASLEVARAQMMGSLNQLMNAPTEQIFKAEFKAFPVLNKPPLDDLLRSGEQWSPMIKINEAQIKIAEARIDLLKDKKLDKLDGFATVGARAKYGDTVSDTVNEQDYAVSIGLEYQKTLDKHDVSAEISQNKIDRMIAQREIESLKRDMKFNMSRILLEIDKTQNTVEAIRHRLDQEKEKLDEGVERYRRGRADTQQLILFENDMSFAEFSLEQQKIELAKKFAKLDVLSGNIWQRVIPLEKPEESSR